MIASGETEVISPLLVPVAVCLPKIGDGSDGTVTPGTCISVTTQNIGTVAVLDHTKKRIVLISPRHSKLFCAVEALGFGWSYADLPLTYPGSRVSGGLPPGAHTHPVADVVTLQTLLDGKAPNVHTHIITDTTGLQTTLDGKADDAHSHAIADVTALQAALDGKAPTSHAHTISDTTGLAAAIAAKADTTHSHAEADVTGLVADLAGKAAVSHNHAASEITSGVLAIARLASGTPDGTKFVKDDGTLATPAGGGGASADTFVVCGADQSNSTVTAAAVTGLATVVAAGTYLVKYWIVYRSAATTTGIQMYLRHNGTTTRLAATWYTLTTGGAAATGIADQATTATSQMMEGKGQRASAVASGANAGVDTANADQFAVMEGLMIVTVSGTLDLMFNSEVAASAVTMMKGTTLVLTKVA